MPDDPMKQMLRPHKPWSVCPRCDGGLYNGKECAVCYGTGRITELLLTEDTATPGAGETDVSDLARQMGDAGYCNYQACEALLNRAYLRGHLAGYKYGFRTGQERMRERARDAVVNGEWHSEEELHGLLSLPLEDK